MKDISTVLFAEDSPDDAALIKIALGRANFPLSLQFVEDGIVATEYLEGKSKYSNRKKYPLPCVVLTDLKMPRMNGFDLLEWVRSHEQFKKLPVIVVTSSNETQDRKRAIELGANAYLTKGLLLHPPASLIEAILRYANQVPASLLGIHGTKLRISTRKAAD